MKTALFLRLIKVRFVVSILLLFSILLPVLAEDHDSGSDETKQPVLSLDNLVQNLSDANFREKEKIIRQLGQLDDERSRSLFTAFLEGRLFYRKNGSKQVIIAELHDGNYRITDILSGKMMGEVSKREIKKIRVNNKLRRVLRSSIAHLDLNAKDPEVRIGAIKNLTKNLNPKIGRVLRDRFEIERDKEAKNVLSVALALIDIKSTDQSMRLGAIAAFSGRTEPQVVTTLNQLIEQNPDGTFKEANERVRAAAQKTLNGIQSRIKRYEILQTIFFGLSLGSVLVLAAIGLAITFGVMGVINMAHGELIMLGAYTTYVVQLLMPNQIDYSLFVAIPAAFIVAALFGILIERGVIRFLYGRPLETLLATFGISLVLQQMVRTIFSPLNRSVSTPAWMSGSVEINNVLSLTLNRMYIIVFTAIVFLILLAILKKTRLGLEVRAVSQNRAMAKAMGIRSEWVDALTFGLGSGIAGVAGVALSQLTNVGPNLGQSYLIDCFMVVVFGGVGNLWGTLISGMSLGIVNKFLEPFAGAVLAKILVLVFIIIFIQKRPRGLFPQKGRAAES